MVHLHTKFNFSSSNGFRAHILNLKLRLFHKVVILYFPKLLLLIHHDAKFRICSSSGVQNGIMRSDIFDPRWRLWRHFVILIMIFRHTKFRFSSSRRTQNKLNTLARRAHQAGLLTILSHFRPWKEK